MRMCAEGQVVINVRGLELLQARPGESADEAWNRMKGKLGTGRHLDETMLYLPDAVVVSGGKTSLPEPTTGEEFVADPPGSGSPFAGNTGVDGQKPELPNLFGNADNGQATAVQTPYSAPPTSGLNLLGQVEAWGIRPATTVTNVSLKVGKMTGAQLQQLLKHLPDGVTYGLDLEKEDT